MKIKLVMPPRSFLNEAKGMTSIPPMGIAHLASFIKQKGYEVSLDDLDIKVINDKCLFDTLLDLQKQYDQNDIEEYLANNKPNHYLDKITSLLLQKIDYKGYDIIGFSIIESSAIDSTLLLAKKIKQETNAIIVLGGTCVRPSFKETYKFIDHIVIGEGETALLKIVNHLENKPQPVETLTFPKPVPDFEGLPLSCYKTMPEGGQFSNYGKILILPYIWSWGCPYNCAFCGNSISNRKVYSKTVEQTVTELEELSKKYTKFFFILNEYIHTIPEDTRKLCQEIINKKLEITWCGSARCDIDNSLLQLLRKAGCCYIYFGLESGSDNILKKMRKGFTKKLASKTIKEAHNSNMWITASMIVGFPQETEKDFEETFDFINKHQKYIDFLAVSQYYLVESAVTREPEKFGIEIMNPVGWDTHAIRDRFSYNETNGHSWKELKKIKTRRLQKLLKLFYLHKSIPESFLRSSTYDSMYALDKFKDKKKAWNFLKKLYNKRLNKEEPVINITSLCNNNCKFCKKPKNVTSSNEEIAKKVEEAKKNNAKMIVLSGGEPTVHKSIFEIVEYIKNQGLEVKLNTNARALSIPSFCEKMYNAGVRIISVKLYSHELEVHDKITKVPKSFEQTIRGINNWKRLGGEVEIKTVLFKENKKKISEFVDFILDLETHPTF